MFKNFRENLQYPSYEIILVDNASKDRSLAFLKSISDDFPLKIIKNQKNESFSRANNQAAEIADGTYLLLLNNDVEPTYGWLNQMMYTALRSENAGAVGAKLVYPDCTKSRHNKNRSFKVQHTGIAFMRENHPEINSYYLIDEHCETDYCRVKGIGNVVQYGSWKHKIYFILSEKLISGYRDFIEPWDYRNFKKYFQQVTPSKQYIFLPHG